MAESWVMSSVLTADHVSPLSESLRVSGQEALNEYLKTKAVTMEYWWWRATVGDVSISITTSRCLSLIKLTFHLLPAHQQRHDVTLNCYDCETRDSRVCVKVWWHFFPECYSHKYFLLILVVRPIFCLQVHVQYMYTRSFHSQCTHHVVSFLPSFCSCSVLA